MTAPERLERLMVNSYGDFGRMIDVTTVALASLSPRRRLLSMWPGNWIPQRQPTCLSLTRAERAWARGIDCQCAMEPAAAATWRHADDGARIENASCRPYCHT